MSEREILIFPHPHLRQVARTVDRFDAELAELAAEMFEIMYRAPGIGLAATQIDQHRRLFVADVSGDRSAPLCLVNPTLTAQAGTREMEEGCLSIPGVYETVIRADRIAVRGWDPTGKAVELEADGLLATCIQHEMDHLDGKLFIDYLSPLKRERIRGRMLRDQRERDRKRKPESDA